MAIPTPISESQNPVQVELFSDGVFVDPSDIAVIKPDGGCWINMETGEDAGSFRWQDAVMTAM